jgi:predicted RNA-binding protein with RPS1 domain
LLTALHLEYNLNHRYLNNELLDVTISSRKNKLKDHKRKIIKLYKDTKNYEHKINDDLDSKYRVIIKDLKIAKKQLRNKRKININDVNDPIIEHFNKHEFNNYSNNKTFENLSQRLYKFSDNEISGLKTKWEA